VTEENHAVTHNSRPQGVELNSGPREYKTGVLQLDRDVQCLQWTDKMVMKAELVMTAAKFKVLFQYIP
jgi:hypothetical protein